MAKAKKEEKTGVVVDTSVIKKDVMDFVDSELDKRIDKFVTTKIKKEFVDEVNRANNKLIREKNRKLFLKNIIIILLLCIIGFLVYLLYTEHYFDKFFNSNNNSNTKQEEVIIENNGVIEGVIPTLDELKNEYASYLDPYILSEDSVYLEDYYKGNLTDEIKYYISLNSIDFDKLEIEDDYQNIDTKVLNDICNDLFDKKCNVTSFDYNGNKIRYFDKLNSFVTNSVLERNNSSIVREITNIEVNKNNVVIETVEGLVLDNQISVIYPNQYIGEYNGDLLSYQEQLNKVKYTFKNKKLVSVE